MYLTPLSLASACLAGVGGAADCCDTHSELAFLLPTPSARPCCLLATPHQALHCTAHHATPPRTRGTSASAALTPPLHMAHAGFLGPRARVRRCASGHPQAPAFARERVHASAIGQRCQCMCRCATRAFAALYFALALCAASPVCHHVFAQLWHMVLQSTSCRTLVLGDLPVCKCAAVTNTRCDTSSTSLPLGSAL